MISKFVFPLALCLVVACNNAQPDTTKVEPQPMDTGKYCYEYIEGRDTIEMKTTNENGLISGTLMYNLFEKDRNAGTIKGEMKNDLLIADYTFAAEGTTSVRPVAFRKVGENLLEGYGETVQQDGKTNFKNINSLDFSHSFALSPVDCKP